MGVEGADEDVAWEEGFEVDEGEGVGGLEEDLEGGGGVNAMDGLEGRRGRYLACDFKGTEEDG